MAMYEILKRPAIIIFKVDVLVLSERKENIHKHFGERIENLLCPNYKSVGMFYWMTNLMWAPSCCHICVLQMKYFHIYDHFEPLET